MTKARRVAAGVAYNLRSPSDIEGTYGAAGVGFTIIGDPQAAQLQNGTPNRARLMQMSWGFAAPLMIEAGVELGLFDLLEGEPRTRSDQREKQRP